MKYPYETAFHQYCKNERHYADSTLLIVSRSIVTFWNYFQNGTDEQLNLNDLQASDIQNFLDSLETNLQLKENTINKYLSHIRLYFTFLYSHGLVDHYPMLEINGRKFSRKRKYVINWMSHIAEISQIKSIHPETVLMMVGIAQRFKPEEVLKMRYNTVIGKVTDDGLRKYIKKHVNFEIDDDPYLLGKKFGGYYASDFPLARMTEADRKLIGMPITLQSLRLSFVYSILAQKDKTDAELEKILRINSKTLFYYRDNMLRYNELIEFKMPIQKGDS